MPYYAVAVGKKVGIYETYDECKAQVLNYPAAKFKKFDSKTAAEEFIRQYSNHPSKLTLTKFEPTMPENKHVPALSLPKSNQSLDYLAQKFHLLDERLTRFMTETNVSLENINKRLIKLESQQPSTSTSDILEGPPAKMIKTEDVSQLEPVEDENITIVYTDGACTNNGKTGARAGIGVWFGYEHPLNVSAPVKGPPTNNNAEIQAAKVAIKQAYKSGIRRLRVHTDSKFLISCITDWIHKWKKNGWQLTSGGPVKNKDELVKLDAALQRMDFVEWRYVPGHRGVEGNEMADKLARNGAALYNPLITYSSLNDSL